LLTHWHSTSKEWNSAKSLRVSGCHFITISTTACQPGVVNVCKASQAAKFQHTQRNRSLSSSSWKEELTLEFQAVQSQHGSSDCGLFVLAFSTFLCCGNNPTTSNTLFPAISLTASLRASCLHSPRTKKLA